MFKIDGNDVTHASMRSMPRALGIMGCWVVFFSLVNECHFFRFKMGRAEKSDSIIDMFVVQ